MYNEELGKNFPTENIPTSQSFQLPFPTIYMPKWGIFVVGKIAKLGSFKLEKLIFSWNQLKTLKLERNRRFKLTHSFQRQFSECKRLFPTKNGSNSNLQLLSRPKWMQRIKRQLNVQSKKVTSESITLTSAYIFRNCTSNFLYA